MNKYYYDLHIHSCLSPCGDDDNTPNNICGMAALSGLNIIALTDHNTAKNCPAFFTAAKKYGLIPIAGMELTTSEDIHVVCLFEELSDALRFDGYIETRRVLIKNRPEIFGEQLILDGEDNVIGQDDYLLSNATTVSVEEVHRLVSDYRGICYPAHIDRDANGIIAILGTIPPDAEFTLFELHNPERADEYASRYGIDRERIIISSDAHYLTDIRDKECFFTLNDEPYSSSLVRRELFRLLKGDSL